MASDIISLDEFLKKLNSPKEELEIKQISSLTTEPISSWTYSSDDYHGMVPSYNTGSGISDPAYGAVPTYTISGGSTSATGISWSPNTTPNVTISHPVWTTTNPYTAMGAGTTVDQGGKLKLQGENADVDINGKSLRAWMERVEERLNMLTPNPEMEAEWDQLRKLGERYRKLEKKCQEKTEVWKRLKAMPKVEIK